MREAFYSKNELETMFFGVITPEITRATTVLGRKVPPVTPDNVGLVARKLGMVRELNELCPFTIKELSYLLPRVKIGMVKQGYLEVYKGILVDEECANTGADEEDVISMVESLETEPYKEYFIL